MLKIFSIFINTIEKTAESSAVFMVNNNIKIV